MNQTPDPRASEVADAEHELARLNARIEGMRSVLVRLLQDVVVAESRVGSSEAALLVEANEQLVVSALRAQTDAVTTALALDDMSQSAQLDPLTQLPNRALLRDRFVHAISIAKRRRGRLALLYLDIDNFKEINDTFGHAAGDEVLERVGRCLVSLVREADTVSRYGGDEFVILLTEVAQVSDAVRVAEKVIAALGVPSQVGEHVLSLTASIGVSVYPDDGQDADTLVEKADAAMYRAKRHGLGNFAFHGKEPAGEPNAARLPVAAPPQPVAHHEAALAEHERRHALLQEANEHLILAALSAKELQAAAEQAQQRQTEFMAVVAHELRNPLAPIRIATAMLGRVRTDEPLLPRVQSLIDEQVAHISRLVGDLLDVSRVTTGTPKLERRAVDMAAIIDAAVDTCQPAMDARLQQFSLKVPPGALEVHGDPVGLAQLVSNLLDNASKYTPEDGEIELAVHVADDCLVMTVTDSGIGITPLALPNVFEPFVQDTHAIGFNGVGPGIGLTVVRELVEAHGGTVVASSAGSGLGSQFTVTLPLARAPGGPQP
jgi:diguanylate cyclase (GGDEF)-like protein